MLLVEAVGAAVLTLSADLQSLFFDGVVTSMFVPQFIEMDCAIFNSWNAKHVSTSSPHHHAFVNKEFKRQRCWCFCLRSNTGKILRQSCRSTGLFKKRPAFLIDNHACAEAAEDTSEGENFRHQYSSGIKPLKVLAWLAKCGLWR